MDKVILYVESHWGTQYVSGIEYTQACGYQPKWTLKKSEARQFDTSKVTIHERDMFVRYRLKAEWVMKSHYEPLD